jgi:DNA-binding FadR family transcriptional regulator
MTYTHQATFFRTALLLGLIPPDAVRLWADAAIESDPGPPHALIEVALAPAELTALRDALRPLADEPEPYDVVRRILGLIAADLAAGRRSAADTVRVLAQMRRMTALPEDLLEELDAIEDDHMLAAAGVSDDLAAVQARMRQWLDQFLEPANGSTFP